MPNQKASELRLQFKFKWKVVLSVLFLFTVFMRLGFWQLDRAEQKYQFQRDRNAKHLANPVPVESLALDNQQILKHMKVRLDGSYDNQKSILVSNQLFQNRPGYEVITAFKLRVSGQIVLVSRGWVSVNYDNKQLPTIEPVTGTQQLVGEIYLPLSNSFFLPQTIDTPANWPLQVHHFDVSNISHLFDRTVLPFVVRLDETSIGVLKRHWQKKRLKPVNSTSYAIQWFGMALILVVISLIKSSNILEIMRLMKELDN
ncbi:MAG: SURF1 family protein [Methylococcales bacterium]